ncbi:Phage repressor protein C, contains Cro/C1-type HTH and peptisase s24 domains [bacterium A37T11]|nr:Phage repressor protein C, contains Cro/C1-type HTH and peptisase s24 domains [bacterium A37T11]
MKNVDIQLEIIGPRLKEARESRGMTLEEFYSPITPHFSNFSAIENERRKIGKRLFKDVISYHHISKEFLATGKGDKFTSSRAYRKGDLSYQEPVEGEEVPFYNVSLTDMAEATDQWKENPEYYINFRPFNDCNAYLPVYGDSMFPKFVNGDLIAVKEVANPEVIQWGEAYLIIADERANNMVTVKLLFEHKDPEKLVLRASNPEFKGDTVITKDAVKKLYIIKGKITRNQL